MSATAALFLSFTADADLSAMPQLEAYTKNVLIGDVWKRPDLSLRDRSIVTVASLVASGQKDQLPSYIGLALDNGVKPSEITAIITHLAFYAGWPNAMSAAGIAKKVFSDRHLTPQQIKLGSKDRLPLNEESDAKRAAGVQENVGGIAHDLARYTNDVLFRDLWLQADLAPRDRSLVTIVSLITLGQSEQLPFHLNRAMDNGLSEAQATEVITHLAFYAGWPKAMSAIPVAKKVFGDRK